MPILPNGGTGQPLHFGKGIFIMKLIPLGTRNGAIRTGVSMVDDEDYDYLMQWKWHIRKSDAGGYYAARSEAGKCILMHRAILKPDKDMMVDHKDFNGLNNQKDNLRFANRSQNSANRRSVGLSKYLGVSWKKPNKKWQVGLCINGEQKYIGLFKTESEAALAYNEAAIKYHGEFANLNIIL